MKHLFDITPMEQSPIGYVNTRFCSAQDSRTDKPYLRLFTMMILTYLLLFSGCSHFRVNATMCDQIRQDPNAINIPAECRDYREEDAAKASLPPEDKGECIDCQKPEKLEYTP